jgi:hypothetical protein
MWRKFSSISPRNWLLAFFILVGLVVIALVLSQRLVLAGSSQRFGLVIDQGSYPPIIPASNNQTNVPIATEIEAPAWVDLEEAQRTSPFTIPQPSWLPPDLRLLGVTLSTGPSADGSTPPSIAVLHYGQINASTGVAKPVMFIQVYSQPTIQGGYVTPADAIQEIQVNGNAGVFAQGAWDENGTWVASANAVILSWADSRFTYVLSVSETDLSKETLIQIASSVK